MGEGDGWDDGRVGKVGAVTIEMMIVGVAVIPPNSLSKRSSPRSPRRGNREKANRRKLSDPEADR